VPRPRFAIEKERALVRRDPGMIVRVEGKRVDIVVGKRGLAPRFALQPRHARAERSDPDASLPVHRERGEKIARNRRVADIVGLARRAVEERQPAAVRRQVDFAGGDRRDAADPVVGESVRGRVGDPVLILCARHAARGANPECAVGREGDAGDVIGGESVARGVRVEGRRSRVRGGEEDDEREEEEDAKTQDANYTNEVG